MRRYFLVSIVAILTAAAGGGSAPTAKSANQEQEQERVVDKATLPDEPVRITGLKNKKKKFKFREKFQDDDEWVSGFTVTILNNSKKTITFLDVNLTFTRPENHETSAEPPLAYDLRFSASPFFPEYALRDKSKVIKPGETFELVLPDEDYRHLKRILKEVKYPASIKRLDLMLHTVGFEDGTVWSGGTMFQPDPNKPGKFIREEPPLSRARDRPADSYIRKLVMTPTMKVSFLHTSIGEPIPMQVSDCGTRGFSPLRGWCTVPPGGEPLTCSYQYDTVNFNTSERIVETVNKLVPCVRWDTERSVYVICEDPSFTSAPQLRQCTQNPTSCPEICDEAGPGFAGPVDYCKYGSTGGCPFGAERRGNCCYEPGGGSCFGAAAAPGSDGPTTNIAPGGGGGGCGCDEVERMNCFNGGGEWSETYCSCVSPVVIDVDGDGFDLTDGAGGVDFDFTGDGQPERLAWTAAGSDDAWLTLDRDGNGMVDSGKELFGSHTPQPAPPAGGQRNGFTALAVYDRADNGGNADGVIDSRDAVFASLRLWQDANHNGISEPGELHTPAALDVARLHLDYKESKRTDEHGNRFRYRAKVKDARGAKVGRWAWDVFPVKPR